MTRRLDFTGEKAATRFALCRTAIFSAGDGKGERTRATLRTEARLLDALDQISVPDPAGIKGGDKDARILNYPEGGTVTITQDDFALLEKYLDTTPWMPRVSRDVVDCQDWISAAEKVE